MRIIPDLFTRGWSYLRSYQREQCGKFRRCHVAADIYRRCEANKKETLSHTVIDWISAKVKSYRISRREKAKFKEELNSWIRKAPLDSLQDYRRVGKKIEECKRRKTETLTIDHSKILELPPIPDHVTHLELEDLSEMTFPSTFPNHAESLVVRSCPTFEGAPSKLPERLKTLKIENCSGFTELPDMPPQLESVEIRKCLRFAKFSALPEGLVYLAVCSTPHANLAEAVSEIPRSTTDLRIEVSEKSMELIGELISRDSRSSDYGMPLSRCVMIYEKPMFIYQLDRSLAIHKKNWIDFMRYKR